MSLIGLEQDDFLMQLEREASSDISANSLAANNSELVIAFVAAVGVNLQPAEDVVETKLKRHGYHIVRIRVTNDVLPKLDASATGPFDNDFLRIWRMMDVGTEARKKHGEDIIALGIAAAISEKRPQTSTGQVRTAYLIHSLKHPVEVRRLRDLYPRGFYLIGVHSPPQTREAHLLGRNGITQEDVARLMDRDKKENKDFGQQLVDTFHLADFFTGWRVDGNAKDDGRSEHLLRNSLERFIEVLFARPNLTPTFGEYAMFLAFSAALRSADLSRQVGAVIARSGEILATGANDCPRYNGGLYWPTLNRNSLKIEDEPRGRDWTRGGDSNRVHQVELIRSILADCHEPFVKTIKEKVGSALSEGDLTEFEKLLRRDLWRVLQKSRIRDLTEYARVVHAEMEALLSCARKGLSTKGATLYSTTFPCHNCAKHIIAAGINRVVFVEPYLKSKALTFHNDAIEIVYPSINKARKVKVKKKVSFEPFSGIGPRRFFDLFSMDMSIGAPLIRKNQQGLVAPWAESESSLRIQMTNSSYIEREAAARTRFEQVISVR